MSVEGRRVEGPRHGLRQLAAKMNETQVWDPGEGEHLGYTTDATAAWMEARPLTADAFVLLADAKDALVDVLFEVNADLLAKCLLCALPNDDHIEDCAVPTIRALLARIEELEGKA